MEPLVLVLAVSDNGVIGAGGRLPWHLPDDLRRFKALTLGHAVVMGRKTHQSIGRPLPGRRNIVVSRDPSFVAPGCEVVPELELALALARVGDPEPRVIGGGEIFRACLPRATRIHLTRVHRTVEGDVHFPELDPAEWRERSREPGPEVDYVELERVRDSRLG